MNENEYNAYFEELFDMNKLYADLFSLSKPDLVKCFTDDDFIRLQEEDDFEKANKSSLLPFIETCKISEKTAFEIVKYINVLYERTVRVLPFEKTDKSAKDLPVIIRNRVQNLGVRELKLIDTVVYGDVEMPQMPNGNELFTVVGEMVPNSSLYKSKKIWVRTISDVDNKTIVRYYTNFRLYLKSLLASMITNRNRSRDPLERLKRDSKFELPMRYRHLERKSYYVPQKTVPNTKLESEERFLMYETLNQKIDYIECFLSTGLNRPPKLFKTEKKKARLPVNVSFVIPNFLKRKDKKRLRNLLISKEATTLYSKDDDEVEEKIDFKIDDDRIISPVKLKKAIREHNVRTINVTESLEELLLQCFILSKSGHTRMFLRPQRNGFIMYSVFRHPRVLFHIPLEYQDVEDRVLPVYNTNARPTSIEGTLNDDFLLQQQRSSVPSRMSEYYIEVFNTRTNTFIREGVEPSSVQLLSLTDWKKDMVIMPNDHSLNVYKLSLLNDDMFLRINDFMRPFYVTDDTTFPIVLNFAIQQMKRIALHGFSILKGSGSKSKMKYLFGSIPSYVAPLKLDYHIYKRREMVEGVEVYIDVRVKITDRAKYLMKNVKTIFPEYKRYDYRLTGEYVDFFSLEDVILRDEKDKKTGYTIIDENDVYEAIIRTNVSNKLTREEVRDARIKKNFENIVLERRKKGEPFRIFDVFNIDKFNVKSIYDLPNPYFD